MKITSIIEMPEGTNEKIEIKDNIPVVDRLLSIPVPCNYGFIPLTLEDDGDPLDVFVISKTILKTLDEVEIKLIGMFECTDQGFTDNKVLATILDEKFDDLTILKNMTQIGDYLLNYKPGFVVNGYKTLDTKNSLLLIENSYSRYIKSVSEEVMNKHYNLLKKLED